MGLPINSPTELAAFVGSTVIRDLSTTLQTVILPSGAKWVQITYRLLPGATGVTNQFAKLVTNASTDAEATGKLGIDGANLPIFQGDDIALAAQAGSLITRLDFITEAAVGAEKSALRIVWGV